MRLSFRVEILAAFLALTGTVLAASLVIVHRSQTEQATSEIRGQLEVTREVFRTLLDRRERQLVGALGLLSGDYAFKQAVSLTKDPATIESAALNFKERIGADAMWVTDDEGRLYADTRRMLEPGTPLEGLSIVEAALDGEASAAIELMQGRPYQLAATPILAPDVTGVLVAGFRLDDEVALELKRLTRSEVSFGSAEGLFATTLGLGERKGLEGALREPAPGAARLVGQGDERWLVLSFELTEGIAAHLQRDWDAALAPLREQERGLLATGALGLGLSLLAGWLIAGGVAAPVRRLSIATGRLLEGDYSVRVPVSRRDEIGQLAEAFNSMVAGLQEKEKIRSVLRKAVSKEIADELLKRGSIELGGEERTVTVLFSDIRGFTTISESLSPKELVSQLNDYFRRMTRAIEAQGGVVDKFVGDAIMALFGAPVGTPIDAAKGLRAALSMFAELDALNRERSAAGLSPLEIGVGLNTGAAVAGTMGSEERWSYTVVGDSVNLASRLEGLNKHYGTRALAAKETLAAAGGDFLRRPLDLVRVKGKHEPVEVFELLGEGAAAPVWLGRFEEGVRAFRDGAFSAARAAFDEVLRAKPGDRPSELYLERLAALPERAPAGWDPAATMTEK